MIKSLYLLTSLICCFSLMSFASGTSDKIVVRSDEWTVGEGEKQTDVWRQADFGRIEVRFDPRSDWSGANAVIFTLDSEVATDSEFILYIGSENEESEGIDYYMSPLKLDWTGPKEFVVPVRELSVAREPLGWDQIDCVGFISDGWGYAPHPDAVIKMGDFRISSKSSIGCRITDKELFEKLNLELPGLESVRRAVENEDYANAKKALADHIRQREHPKWFIDWRDHPFMNREPLTPDMDRAPGQWDYFSKYIELDFEGWKKFTLKKSDFDQFSYVEGKGEEGKKPVGWNWISRILFAATGWDMKPDPNMKVNIDEIKLVGKDREVLIEDFEEEGDHGGLKRTEEIVREGTASGLWTNPTVNSRAIFSDIPNDWTDYDQIEFWLYSPKAGDARIVLVLDSDYSPTAVKAMKYVDREFTYSFAGSKPFTKKFEDKIDWAGNATTGEDFTHLWNEKLNRHYHFVELAQAYWETGDELFAETLAGDWLDWIESNPRPVATFGNRPSDGNYSWQTLTTGIRVEHIWWNSLYRCLKSPAFTDELIVSIIKSTYEQAQHLKKWPSSGNWLTEEMSGLFTVGMMFPEFKEASEWRRIGIETIYGQMDDEVYPDGMQFELAAGYSDWVTNSMAKVLERTEMNGYRNEVPKDFEKKLEKMYDYRLFAMMPNGYIPGLNDSGQTKITDMLMDGYEYFPERKDFLFGATLGAKGEKPDRLSVAFPYTGHYVMRSGWERDGVYLLFDSGKLGRGHQHEDKLHVILWAYDNYLLLDPGNYSYDKSKWRQYVIGTAGHNTVMVDGQPQNRKADRANSLVWPKPWDQPVPPGNNTVWISKDDVDYAKGTYEKGYGPEAALDVEHIRRILYLKPDCFVIHDTLIPKDDEEHLYDALFHFAAKSAEVDPDTLVVETTTGQASYLCLYPAGEGLTAKIVEGQEDPVQGWTSGPFRPTPTLLVSKTAKGRVDMCYVLQPVRDGEKSPIKAVSQVERDGDAVGVVIEYTSGEKKTVTFTDTPGEEFTVE